MSSSTCQTWFSPQLKDSVAALMHAYGDVEAPLESSVEFMCGLLFRYMDDTIVEAMKVAYHKGGKFDADCLVFTCKYDLPTFKVAKTKLQRKRAVEALVGCNLAG